MKTVDVLGISTSPATLAEAASAVVERSKSGDGGFVCLCNVHVLVAARRSATLGEALRLAWAVLADGAPILWLQRKHDIECERVSGTELLHSVVAEGRAVGVRHVLFGSTPEVVEQVASRLRELYPGVILAAVISPPTGSFEDLGARWLEAIKLARPDVVWCALGAPKQELWMRRYEHELAPAVLVGVGAAFDFVAGSKRRAPHWMQRTGFEWLYRFGNEPRRLFRRYLSTNAEFLYLMVRDAATRVLRGAGQNAG